MCVCVMTTTNSNNTAHYSFSFHTPTYTHSNNTAHYCSASTHTHTHTRWLLFTVAPRALTLVCGLWSRTHSASMLSWRSGVQQADTHLSTNLCVCVCVRLTARCLSPFRCCAS